MNLTGNQAPIEASLLKSSIKWFEICSVRGTDYQDFNLSRLGGFFPTFRICKQFASSLHAKGNSDFK